jgi:hypothetical protein
MRAKGQWMGWVGLMVDVNPKDLKNCLYGFLPSFALTREVSSGETERPNRVSFASSAST